MCVCAQFDPVVGDLSSERAKNLEMLTKMAKKQPIIDVEKATNRHMAEEERR